MGKLILNGEEYSNGKDSNVSVQELQVTGDKLATITVSGIDHDIYSPNSKTFTMAVSRANINSGETYSTIFGKIKKFFNDLKAVAFSGSYNDLSDKPTIPTVGNGTLTIQKNGTTVKTFTANQSGDVTANIQHVAKTVEISTSNVGAIVVTHTATTSGGRHQMFAYGNGNGIPWMMEIQYGLTYVKAIVLCNTSPKVGVRYIDNTHFAIISGSWDNVAISDLYDSYSVELASTSYTIDEDNTFYPYASSCESATTASKIDNIEFENNNSTGKNANDVTYNGHTYYTSNGPSTSLGASSNDGALYAQAYSDKWVAQIAQDYVNGRLFVRGKNNGTWQSWLRIALYSEIPDISTKVSKSGDTLTGELNIQRATGSDAQYRSTNTTTGYQISFGYGSGGTNRGIWDTQLNKWIFHSTGTAVYVNGVAFPTTAKLTDTTNQLSNYYSSRPTSCNIQLGDGTVRYFVATSSMTTSKPTSGDAHILHLAWDNNGGWDGQLALPTTDSNHMQWRTQTNGTWGEWKTLIDSTGGTIENDLTISGNILYLLDSLLMFKDALTGKTYAIHRPTGSLSTNRDVYFPNKGGTIAFTSDISSRRYKENIVPLSDDEAKKILDVEIVNYDYKENVVDEDERYDQKGAIAEDVVNLIPNAVTYADVDGEQLPDGINYTKFIPYLIKMVQIQQKEIEELKAMIREKS